MKQASKVVGQAFAIVAASAAVGIAVDLARPDGIPLVTDVPYEIFAPCRDSEATVRAAASADLVGLEPALYVDARPNTEFETEHVASAINVPYSPLFGAAAEDVEKVEREARKRGARVVIVYGTVADPSAPGETVDLARPLAQQLVEAGVEGARHVAGGLETLKKNGIATVKGDGRKP